MLVIKLDSKPFDKVLCIRSLGTVLFEFLRREQDSLVDCENRARILVSLGRIEPLEARDFRNRCLLTNWPTERHIDTAKVFKSHYITEILLRL